MSLLINCPKSAEHYVYHYTRLETALANILPEGKLRFSPMEFVNDPREAKEWIPSVELDSRLNLERAEWNAVTKEVSNFLRKGVKIVCFTTDHASTTEWEDFNARSKRGYASAPMWHFYGNRHQGVCLVFDRERLHNAFEQEMGASRLRASPVHYTDTEWVPQLRDSPFFVSLVGASSEGLVRGRMMQHLERHWKPLYCRKLTDWSYEREFRWVYFGADDDYKSIAFRDALVGITLGADADLGGEEDILRHCASYRSEAARLTWRNGQPTLEGLAMPYLTRQYAADSPE